MLLTKQVRTDLRGESCNGLLLRSFESQHAIHIVNNEVRGALTRGSQSCATLIQATLEVEFREVYILERLAESNAAVSGLSEVGHYLQGAERW